MALVPNTISTWGKTALGPYSKINTNNRQYLRIWDHSIAFQCGKQELFLISHLTQICLGMLSCQLTQLHIYYPLLYYIIFFVACMVLKTVDLLAPLKPYRLKDDEERNHMSSSLGSHTACYIVCKPYSVMSILEPHSQIDVLHWSYGQHKHLPRPILRWLVLNPCI